MSDILDIMRDFMLFTQKIERDMYETVKKLQLPDELDIYNFFETWAGRAECHLCEGAMTACSINDYVKLYDDSISIRYHIGRSKYYALRFNGRGVFLVSEKRYKELKTKKGTTV